MSRASRARGSPRRGRTLELARLAGAAIFSTAVAVIQIPGVDAVARYVQSIISIVEQMKYYRRQALRVAKSAGHIKDAVRKLEGRHRLFDTDDNIRQSVSALVDTLRRVEGNLRDISASTFMTMLLNRNDIPERLANLEDDCRQAKDAFFLGSTIDLRVSHRNMELQIHHAQKAQRDDHAVFMANVKNITQDMDKVAQVIGCIGNVADHAVARDVQLLVDQIDNDERHNIPPEVLSFAEVATRTLKSRSNVVLTRKKSQNRQLDWIVSKDELTLGEQIGSGAFSIVFKGYWKTKDMVVSVKVFREHESITDLTNEIILWRNFDHPSLHSFLGAAPFETPLSVIAPYYKNGNVIQYHKQNPDLDCFQIIHSVCRGMDYLHSQNIIHRDLKGTNILIDDDGKARIADFGLTRRDVPQRTSLESTGPLNMIKVPQSGTFRWLAPECFWTGKQDRASDIWAVGMIAYELFTHGLIPFGEIRDDDVGVRLNAGARPVPPTNETGYLIPEDAWIFMNQCWKLLPLNRPGFPELAAVTNLYVPYEESGASGILRLSSLSRFRLSRWPRLMGCIVQRLRPLLLVLDASCDNVAPHSPTSYKSKQELHASYLINFVDATVEHTWYSSDRQDDVVTSGIVETLLSVLTLSNFSETLFRLASKIITSFWNGDPTTRRYQIIRVHMLARSTIDPLIGLIGRSESADLFVLPVLRKMVTSQTTTRVVAERILNSIISAGALPKLASAISLGNSLVREATCCIIEQFSLCKILHEFNLEELAPPLVEFSSLGSNYETRFWTVGKIAHALCRFSQMSVDHAKYLHSIDCFPRLLPLWGNEKYLDVPLEILATPQHVPALLQYLQLESVLPDTAKLVIRALSTIGSRITPEGCSSCALGHSVYISLLPIMRSDDVCLVHEVEKVIYAFSPKAMIPDLLLELRNHEWDMLHFAAEITFNLIQRFDLNLTERLDVLSSLGTFISSLPATIADALPLGLHPIILSTLEHLCKGSDSDLDSMAGALVDHGLHIYLVGLIEDKASGPCLLQGCLSILLITAKGADAVKSSLVQTPLFWKLCRVLNLPENSNAGSKHLASSIITALLMSDDERGIATAVIEAGLVEPLANHLVNGGQWRMHGVAALFDLVVYFGDSPSPEVQELAIRELHAYVETSGKEIDVVIGMRMYLVDEFICHRQTRVKELGLRITLTLLQGASRWRRSIAQLKDIREHIIACIVEFGADGTLAEIATATLREFDRRAEILVKPSIHTP